MTYRTEKEKLVSCVIVSRNSGIVGRRFVRVRVNYRRSVGTDVCVHIYRLR